MKINLFIAHASDRDLANARLRWQLSDGSSEGERELDVPGWGASDVGKVTLRPPSPGRFRLELELLDRTGATAGRNWTDLAVFERPQHRMPAWSENPALQAFLTEAEWPIDRADGVPVAAGLIPSAAGVLLASAGDESEGVRAVERDHSPWEGDWAQGMHWFGPLLRQGTPLLPRLDMTCSGLVPEAVLTGPRPEQALAGMYVGWIHKPVATAARLRRGVVATTFPILKAGPRDPLAVCLLDNLLRASSR
jgi:hypothetical protein